MKELLDIHASIKADISRQKRAFKASYNNLPSFLTELIFCLCTPQTSAHKSWNAVQYIMAEDVWKSATKTADALSEYGVRFKNNKAGYIFEAMANRAMIYKNVHEFFDGKTPQITVRNWLAQNIKGYGLKEASHFLRNIGHGNNLCILDRHILRCLVDFNVIDSIPKSLTKAVYFDIERKMLSFSEKIGIEPDDLDFVFWYRQNGEIFK